MAEYDRWRGGFEMKSLPGARDHLLRSVAGEDGDSAVGKKEGVFPGAAVEFQKMSARRKSLEKNLPNRVALGAADEGFGELAVVRISETIKDGPGGVASSDVDFAHASTSCAVAARASREARTWAVSSSS
jgi:hypothetical protein